MRFLALCGSIKVTGLINILIVRELNNGNYEVLDGVRRLRALKAIHVTRLPIWILKDVKNDTDALIVSLVPNVHCQGLEKQED
jgi:ParB-like chromosome segregation protein Spo0J